MTHVLRMKYQHIPQNLSVIKYFQGQFNLRPPLRKFFFIWDVQIIFQKSRRQQSNLRQTRVTKTPNTVIASRRATPKLCMCDLFVRPATLLKQRLWHRCFPVNFAQFLRTPSLQNTSGRLLLWLSPL